MAAPKVELGIGNPLPVCFVCGWPTSNNDAYGSTAPRVDAPLMFVSRWTSTGDAMRRLVRKVYWGYLQSGYLQAADSETSIQTDDGRILPDRNGRDCSYDRQLSGLDARMQKYGLCLLSCQPVERNVTGSLDVGHHGILFNCGRLLLVCSSDTRQRRGTLCGHSLTKLACCRRFVGREPVDGDGWMLPSSLVISSLITRDCVPASR